MRPFWICSGLLLAGLFASACEDPSNVGLGLLDPDELGGAPDVVVAPPTLFERDSLEDVTGNALRVLAGAVDDPLIGTITATGYLDFSGSASSDFRGDESVDRVQLVLVRDYIYGDTTGTVTLRLRDMTDDWPAANVTADTTLEEGPAVHEFSFAAADTLIEVPLPDEWVEANDATLRHEDMPTEFHGFRIEAVDGNAVVGFTRDDSFLRAITTDDDTTDFTVSKLVTTTARDADPAALPDDVLLVQDGIGLGARMMFDFTADSVQYQPLNRAVLALQNDRDLLEQTPAGFHRPQLAAASLIGVDEEGAVIALTEETTVDADGQLAFENPALRAEIQRLLFEESPLEHFRLAIPTANNTIDVLFLQAPSSSEPPEVRLTLTPSQN